MGKPTGFLEYERVSNTWMEPSKRMESFEEFQIPLDEKQRRQQASRCMNCGVPYCQSAIELKGMVTGCPLHNLIPEWNDAIYRGYDKIAFDRLLKVNPFPEFTGRVCPALCEKACLNGLDGQSVSIHDNEKYIIEIAYQKGWMKAQIPTVRTDRKIAIIGSGPAGLSAAYLLNQRGHSVTVYEKEDQPGGLLMYGIPNMKLNKTFVERRIVLLKQEGIKFVCNTEVGKDITRKELEKEYDAIILCVGSKTPRDLNCKNRNCEGVYFAVDFLTKNTKHLLNDKEAYINTKNKNVVVVGGGDTGNDCVGTCMRHGAKSVIQLEMMPKAPDERLESNPWPEWPKVCKTDYGQQEVIAKFGHDPRIYSTTVKECIAKDGHLKQIKTVQVGFVDGKLTEVKGSEQILDCDVLLIAAGFVGVEKTIKEDFQLECTARNVVKADEKFQTKADKIFVAGDCHRGQSLVVWAIAEGKKAAEMTDKFLMGYSSIQS